MRFAIREVIGDTVDTFKKIERLTEAGKMRLERTRPAVHRHEAGRRAVQRQRDVAMSFDRPPDWRRCPRCEAAVFIVGSGASSRVPRDAGARIEVCSRCGERESLYGYGKGNQVPFTDWPVEVDVLVEEERALIERFRATGVRPIPMDQLEPSASSDEG